MGLDVSGDGRAPVIGDDPASELLVGVTDTLRDLVVAGHDGRVGLDGSRDRVLEGVIEALVRLVGTLVNDAVDDLGRGSADGSKEEAFTGDVSGGDIDRPDEGGTIASIGRNERGGDGVLKGKGFDAGGITGLEATGTCEDERTCPELTVIHFQLLQWLISAGYYQAIPPAFSFKFLSPKSAARYR